VVEKRCLPEAVFNGVNHNIIDYDIYAFNDLRDRIVSSERVIRSSFDAMLVLYFVVNYYNFVDIVLCYVLLHFQIFVSLLQSMERNKCHHRISLGSKFNIL